LAALAARDVARIVRRDALLLRPGIRPPAVRGQARPRRLCGRPRSGLSGGWRWCDPDLADTRRPRSAPPSVDGDVRRLDADVTATHRLRDRARVVGGRSCGIRRNGVARRRPDSLVDVAATVRAARATR